MFRDSVTGSCSVILSFHEGHHHDAEGAGTGTRPRGGARRALLAGRGEGGAGAFAAAGAAPDEGIGARWAGVPSPHRRPRRHRARRERMPQAGMLLRVDGSRHTGWLGADGPWLTLIAGIDDATNDIPWAVFREAEDAQGYLLMLRRSSAAAVSRWPSTVTVQIRADEPLPPDEVARSWPGRAPRWAACFRSSTSAGSGRGRCKRRGARGTALPDAPGPLGGCAARPRSSQANVILPALLQQHNTRFRQLTATPSPAYRRPTAGLVDAVFSFKYWRTVSNDNVVTVEAAPSPSRPDHSAAPMRGRASRSGSIWMAAPVCTSG